MIEARPADAAVLDFDVLVVGAGMSGMYQLHLLRQMGLRVRVLEAGTGVGGTWYWNRYPGARFDSESYSYGYSFSPEMLAEWNWTEHFAPQTETEGYLNLFADKFDLRRDIRFRARVASAHWSDDNGTWAVTLDDGTTYRSRFLITALGPLSAPTMPRFEGIDDFNGPWFHTGLWPKERVDFAGKRVAVIGTGASGVQTIAEVAKTAAHLTVFQRRPNWCTPLHNRPIAGEEMERIRAGYPQLFAHCMETNACFIHSTDPRGTFEVSEEERNAFWEHLYNSPGFGIWQGNFRDVLVDREPNRLMSEFVANKIRQRVNNQRIAELLIPRDHGFATRRVPQETRYYEVYNQPNVRLVSMLETPIERITPTGIRTAAEDFAFDLIIYATGFDAVTGSYDRIDLRGAGGVRLKDCWTPGPETLLGIFVPSFPNMFMAMGPHSAFGNIPRSIEFNVEWIRDLIGHMTEHGHSVAQAREDAVADWMEFAEKQGEGLLSNEIDSWMTGVNMNVEGRQVKRLVRYAGSAPQYRARCTGVAEGGYRELAFG